MTFTFDPNMMNEQMAGMIVTQETYRICTEHEGCIDCLLKGGNMVNIKGANVVCETGRMKGGNNER